MKKALFVFALLSLLVSPSAVIAQAPPPKPTNADAVIAAFKAAGLEAESPKAMTRKDYGLAPYVCKGIRFLIPSLGEDAGGRAFFCPRKGDGEKLAKYYNSLGEQSAILFSHVFQQPPYVVQINGDLPDEQAAKYEMALQQLVAGQEITKPVAMSEPLIKVTFDRAGYDYWGRPRYMIDKTATDCGREDEKHQVLRLEISLTITNNSPTQTMKADTWKGQFYKPDGSEAMTCHWGYSEKVGRPEIAPGQSTPVTYMAFVEKGERVAYGFITDDVLGQSSKIEVPTNLPLP
jgi:hypothetical protein